MIVENKKYAIKRIIFESLFPILIAINTLFYFFVDKPQNSYEATIWLLVFSASYLAFQSLFGYWPKLTIDALFFIKKTDTFRVIGFKPTTYGPGADGKTVKKHDANYFHVIRLSDNKEILFPAESITGCQLGDIVSIKYYRLSKIILKCEVVQKAEQTKK